MADDFGLRIRLDEPDEQTTAEIAALADEIGVPKDYIQLGLTASGTVAGQQLQSFDTVSELRAGIIYDPGHAITGKLLLILLASDSKTIKLDGVTYQEKDLDTLDNKVMVWAKANGFQAKKGCYVATAVYGSYECPEVWTLRRYRDSVLGENAIGRLFVKTYYAISPALVAKFGNVVWLSRMVRASLDRIVTSLNSRGFSDAAYNDQTPATIGRLTHKRNQTHGTIR